MNGGKNMGSLDLTGEGPLIRSSEHGNELRG
jgi:hypothetical protein